MAIENALRDSLRRRSWHIGWLKNQVPGVVALLLAAEREAIDRKSPYIAPSDLSRVLRRASDHGTPPIAGLGAAMLAESGYPPPLRALRLRPDSASRRVTALATRNARRARRALAHVDYAVALEDLPDPEFLRSMKDQGLAAGSVREAVEHLGILMRDFAEAQEELLAKKDAMQFWMREQPLLKLPYITARDRAILLNNAAWYLLVYHWPEHAALAEKIARTAFEAWPCYVIRDTLALALVATDHVDAGLELTWGMVDNVELPPSSRGSLLAIAALAAGLRGDNVAQQDYLAQAEQLAADKDLLAMVHRVLELPPKTSEAASS
jgi:hypothetical protein